VEHGPIYVKPVHYQNDRRLTLHRSSNTFHQRKCVIFVIFVCLPVDHIPQIATHLLFALYWNAIESSYIGGYALHWWMVK